jgi:hypothetical protein
MLFQCAELVLTTKGQQTRVLAVSFPQFIDGCSNPNGTSAAKIRSLDQLLESID